MFIYTDDLEFASKVLPNVKSRKNVDLKKIDNPVNDFISEFYNTTEIYITEQPSQTSWHYLILTKHSKQSQFDLLYKIAKTNSELPDRFLCLADSGSKFHGYRNREWKAHSGNLHLSIYLKPNRTVLNFHIGFTILAAISVIETLDLIPQIKNISQIKWVNDIQIDDSKIGGVITQTQSQNDLVTALVLGIGLNIDKAPTILEDKFVSRTTSLKIQINTGQYDFSEIFFNLLHKIIKNYNLLLQGEYHQLLNIYRKRSLIINKDVNIYSDPMSGSDSLIASGKVLKIGDDLELYIEGLKNPIRSGRLIIKK